MADAYNDSDSFHTETSSRVKTAVDEETSNFTSMEDSTVAGNNRESRVVSRSKMIVYMSLFAAALVTGAVTFVILTQEEEDNFEKEFRTFAAELHRAASQNINNTARAINNLATSVTTHLLTTNATAPYFNYPFFERQAAEARDLSGAELIATSILTASLRLKLWNGYSALNAGWIRDGLDFLGMEDVNPGRVQPVHQPDVPQDVKRLAPFTFNRMQIYSPIWEMSPAPTNASVVNQDLFGTNWFVPVFLASTVLGNPVISKIVDLNFITKYSRSGSLSQAYDFDKPRSAMVMRYYTSFDSASSASGTLLAVLPWENYFQGLLPEGRSGFIIVIDDGCGTTATYEVNGRQSEYIGRGDFHDTNFDYIGQHSRIAFFGRHPKRSLNETEEQQQRPPGERPSFNETYDGPIFCPYTLSVYPSNELRDSYHEKDSYFLSSLIVFVFLFTTFVFFVYDVTVQRRQRKVQKEADKSKAIVSSLFPKSIQDRILGEIGGQCTSKKHRNVAGKYGIRDFLHGNHDSKESSASTSKPIADLFPESTIIFADMVGFTAWSSTREPAQVFLFLETIYRAFDIIAERRRVYKVETIGDCYVAVAGLPEPRKDHAVVMARFARDILRKFSSLTKELEETLGPDTGDLGLRVGLHSGPVTAGVLRGQRARFQLFGDTVNTASRMESTGFPNRIQVSKETANLLTVAGKNNWVRERAEKIVAKGKGELQTYWLEIKHEGTESTTSSEPTSQDENNTMAIDEHKGNDTKSTEASVKKQKAKSQEKIKRLVTWNTEVLSTLLKHVLARREAACTRPDEVKQMREIECQKIDGDNFVLDEVVEIITLPTFDVQAAKNEKDASLVELDEQVTSQLQHYVRAISELYRDNAFHNFEHVSHVCMSVVKLLGRIVMPELDEAHMENEQTLHDHTYGITSDPLTQFACVFAALIHDVDHVGVSNAQLVKEKATIASAYRNQSVLEQNSVDIAWNLLMQPAYEDLRRAIYSTESEFRRFRQLVVNAVMATDVLDKDLNAARKARWEKAFAVGEGSQSPNDDINRKATIVIEHLIQASDVAHTMQHWHIYRKWNTRLFQELYNAYQQGRAGKDPAEFWYEGELAFFDRYVIPLAKKLKDCGVFGVSSDEYLIYACQNRDEWSSRGKEIVSELVEMVKGSGGSEKLLEMNRSQPSVEN